MKKGVGRNRSESTDLVSALLELLVIRAKASHSV